MFSLIVTLTLAQVPGLPYGLPPGLEREYTARNAAVDAHLDLLANVPGDRQECTFYVWDNCGASKESYGCINYTVNAVLNARPKIISPVRLAGGRLLRYYLYDFANFRNFSKLRTAFDKIADFDPVFHEPAHQPQVKRVWDRVPPYLASDGKWYDYTARDVIEYRKIQASVGSGGAGPLLLLEELTHLHLPILAADWMIPTFWSAIKIDGVTGQYYQLRGIQVGGDPKKGEYTDFDAFLIQFGVDPKKFKDLPSAQRTIMKSVVAKRYRQIEITPQNTVQPQYGPGILSVTHDITNLEDDPAKDPLENIIDFEDAAREIIASLPCGLHAYLLTNGAGLAATEVPPNVAGWPHSPHSDAGGGTFQLVPGVACLECHGQNRGWNHTENTIRKLKADGFFAKYDFRVGKYTAKEFEDRASDLYDGEINLPLKLAGTGYGIAADQVTAGAWGLKSIEGVSAGIFAIYTEYFKEIGTARALREIGYRWTGKDEEALKRAFNEIIPRQEDDPGRTGALRINEPITRAQWNQIRFELCLRDRLHNEDIPPAIGPQYRFGPKLGAMKSKTIKTKEIERKEIENKLVEPSKAVVVTQPKTKAVEVPLVTTGKFKPIEKELPREARQQELPRNIEALPSAVEKLPRNIPSSMPRIVEQELPKQVIKDQVEPRPTPVIELKQEKQAIEYVAGSPGITIYGQPGSHIWLGKKAEYMGRLNGAGIGSWDFRDLHEYQPEYHFAIGDKWYTAQLFVDRRTVVRREVR